MMMRQIDGRTATERCPPWDLRQEALWLRLMEVSRVDLCVGEE